MVFLPYELDSALSMRNEKWMLIHIRCNLVVGLHDVVFCDTKDHFCHEILVDKACNLKAFHQYGFFGVLSGNIYFQTFLSILGIANLPYASLNDNQVEIGSRRLFHKDHK